MHLLRKIILTLLIVKKILKQKEIFNELYGKRFEKIEDSTKKLILIN